MPSARYEIIRQLACGGMAEVLLARRTPDDGAAPELVVIKRVLPHLTQADGFMRMFATESRIASQLRHPNIVSVVEVGEMDQLPFIAMERLDGADLLRLLQQCVLRRQQLGPAVAMAVVAGAARGLGYAHRARARDGRPLKIIHRDVSPHNIFVTRDGGVKLLDFGIAKSAAQATNTHTGQVKGKISYMSPEQIRAKPLDARSDLWSLGVVLWESVAGEKLFTRDNDAATLHAILHDPIPALAKPEAPGLDELIAAVLHRDPAKRVGTAEEIAQRLDALLQRTGHANPAKLVAQRVASLVPALNPEIDAARPAAARNPEVVTFALGPALSPQKPTREAPAADRGGAHRRLSIANAPVVDAPLSDEDDPTLLEIAAPPADPDFDPEETIERADHPRVGENTDTHTIPLRPAIQATGTAGAENFAAVARAMAAPAPARAVAAVQPRRPVLPASIEFVPELSAEFEPESDDSLTAPLRRPPTLAMPPNRAPQVAPRPAPSPAVARSGGPAPLQNPLSGKATATVPPAGRSSPPPPLSSPPPSTASSPPRPSTVPPSARSSSPDAPRPSAAPPEARPAEAPKVSAVHEARPGARPSSPEPANGQDLAALFGAPPPAPASPFGDIPPLQASAPVPSQPRRDSRDTLSAAEVPAATGPRRTQRIDTVQPPRRKGRLLAFTVGGLCAVAGLVVLGAYLSGSLRGGASEAATASALRPAAQAPAAPTAPPPAPAPPPTAAPAEPTPAAPPAPPAPAPAPEEPEVLAPEPSPEPAPAPAPVAAPAAPPAVRAPPPPQAAARAPAPRAAPTRAAPAPTPPRAAPAPAPAVRSRAASSPALLGDPFEALANGGSAAPARAPARATPVRTTAPTPVRTTAPTPVRTTTPTPVRTTAPTTRRGPPPSVRSGTIFQDL